MDFIVANNILKEGAGFKGDTNIVTIIDKDENIIDYPVMDKDKVAQLILDKVKYILDTKS